MKLDKLDKWLIILVAIYMLLAVAKITLAVISPNEFMAAQSKTGLASISAITPAIIMPAIIMGR
nr:MAG TPA: hypothetical protein [Caudoviricetes sp.]